MRTPTLLVLSSIFIPLINAQAAADGLIVPFSSVLPACASKCGKLFDVQGACTPPVLAQTSSSCFCADPRLTALLNPGTAGVEGVCTTASCTATADLEAIQNWYASYCNEKSPNPTTTSGTATATGTSSGGTSTAAVSAGSSKPQTWIGSHWRWVVMVIVIALGIIVVWVGASLLRKRYLRKKEREIEMKPPVAWGPHQMQNQTGGYSEGVIDPSGGRSKEAKGLSAFATPADTRGAKRESKGWLKKNRNVS